MLRSLHVNSFRFSVAWSRVQIGQSFQANDRGLDHYDKVVDSLLEKGICPLVTLYHWDLPQSLELLGGWLNRDTAARFTEYSALMVGRLGDRVKNWALMNEPWVFTYLGYGAGKHAPGRCGFDLFMRAAHNTNLAQGMALASMRAQNGNLSLGSCINYSPGIVYADGPEHIRALEHFSAINNHWFLEPIEFGTYPASMWSDSLASEMGYMTGDGEIMKQGFDWIGVNYYFRQEILPPKDDRMYMSDRVVRNRYYEAQHCTEGKQTKSGWEIWPEGLELAIEDIDLTYKKPIEITECGCACEDEMDISGDVNDSERVAYLKGHLVSLHQALSRGANVQSFHVWSFLDNFEWTEGVSLRFGLVYVDYENGERKIKSSAKWFSQLAKSGSLSI